MSDAPAVRLMIATPAYDHKVDTRYMRGVVDLTIMGRDLGWTVHWWSNSDSLIPRARNEYVHQFLRGDYTHLLSIDADIIFDPRAVIAMVATEHDVVCCAYPKKGLNWERIGQAARHYDEPLERHSARYVVNIARPDGDIVHPTEGCVPVLDAATGFLMTTRKAIVDMCYAYPDTLYVSDDLGPDTRGRAMFGLFDCYTEPGTLRALSEDFAFSRRWQRMGGTVWLYLGPFCQLGHVGTHEYRGNIYDYFVPQGIGSGASESGLPEDQGSYGEIMLERYEWAAARLVGARSIADACSGPGYGMPILRRTTGAEVVGYDRDPDNARIADEKGYGRVVLGNLEDARLDAHDAVCTIETIEHIPDPIAWLLSLPSSVTRLALSCPCIPTTHVNEFHLSDFSYDEVVRIVRALGWTVREHREQKGAGVILLYAERGAALMAEAA